MREQLHIFFNALAFFTRIPCPQWVVYKPERQDRVAAYAPLIGWVVGLAAALTLALAALILPLAVAVVLAMAVAVWLTGALHEDGFGDVCDGFGGGSGADQIRAIMKDSRIGAYGAIGLILLLLLKITVLVEIGRLLTAAGAALPGLAATLVAGHALSRFAAISVMFTHDYVGGGQASKSALVARPMSSGELGFAAVCGLAPLALFFWLNAAPVMFALAPVLLARYWLGKLFLRRLGGYTGDCLGAVQQLTELAFYLGVCAVVAA